MAAQLETWRMPAEAMADYGATTDWKALAAVDAGVASVANASGGVDWSLPGARYAVARALLRRDFSVAYEASPRHLVPCVPNRLRYLAWVAAVAGDDGSRALRAVDVGAGASCVLALLAARCRGWRVVASEVDAAAAAEARANVARNAAWGAGVQRRRRRRRRPGARVRALAGAGADDAYDVALTNPPWFESEEERAAAAGGATRADGADGRPRRPRALADLRASRVVDADGRRFFMLGQTTRWAVAWTTRAAPGAAPAGDKVFGAKKARKRAESRAPLVLRPSGATPPSSRRVAAFLAFHSPAAAVADAAAGGLSPSARGGAGLDVTVCRDVAGRWLCARVAAADATPTDAITRLCDALPARSRGRIDAGGASLTRRALKFEVAPGRIDAGGQA
ncbi:23S rRNA (adenine(1618)-N(6))-methyltransferase [Aureococcus anophagefferens]|uniref:23S rRNA (Adenine(1618)-N(6))-methyltransferase n=1 Tax=Aureococcus anophagefferens TaxID=44056 RepID=A0ABR1G8G9_AURAN